MTVPRITTEALNLTSRELFPRCSAPRLPHHMLKRPKSFSISSGGRSNRRCSGQVANDSINASNFPTHDTLRPAISASLFMMIQLRPTLVRGGSGDIGACWIEEKVSPGWSQPRAVKASTALAYYPAPTASGFNSQPGHRNPKPSCILSALSIILKHGNGR